MRSSLFAICYFVLLFLAKNNTCSAQLAYSTTAKATVLKDFIYHDTLKTDIYFPTNRKEASLPAVIFINGAAIPGFKNNNQYTSWANILGGEGFVAINYEAVRDHYAENFNDLLKYLFVNANRFHIDTNRIGIYACSVNVLTGLPLANNNSTIKAAVICYGIGKIDQFRMYLPLLYVRAGLDNISLNKQIDSLIGGALRANAPYSAINFHGGHHDFEEDDINDYSCATIEEIIHFLQLQLQIKTINALRNTVTEAQAAGAAYNGQWDDAITYYKSIIQKGGTNAEVYRKMGDAYIETMKYPEAIKAYDSALLAGNWRKGEIANKKLLAFVKLTDWENAIGQLKTLQTIHWLNIDRLAQNVDMLPLFQTDAYKEFAANLPKQQ